MKRANRAATAWRILIASACGAVCVAAAPKKEKPTPTTQEREAAVALKAAKARAPADQPLGALAVAPVGPPLLDVKFADAPYGHTPPGWTDPTARRPGPMWAVDGAGFARIVEKDETALLVYDGAVAGGTSSALGDVSLSCEFKKSEDATSSFGLAGRLQANGDGYAAGFTGDNLLQIFKIKDGVATPVANLVTVQRYREGAIWQMTFAMRGPTFSAAVVDDKGIEQARVDLYDDEFKSGKVALRCTTYAGARTATLRSLAEYKPTLDAGGVAKANAAIAATRPTYPVLRPHPKPDSLNVAIDQLKGDYDIVIAGGGCGGWAAAVQACRMGSRVLLLEETDWLGGQMSAAAVTTMDEDGSYRQVPVRERAIYREFHESMATYYYTLEKDPFIAYSANPKMEGGFEPRVTRAVLYAYIEEAAKRGKGTIDVSVRSRVTKVAKDGNRVAGVSVQQMDEAGATKSRDVTCKILIDATEHGDVLPLTGMRYRVGNVTSDKLDPKAPLQDFTWTAVLREYPEGLPEHLRVKSPPPDYEEFSKKRFAKFQRWGIEQWGSIAKGLKGDRSYRVGFSWRAMADSDSPITGDASEVRWTQCGLNGGNDYPVTVATVEDPKQRAIDERFGLYRTLGQIYYYQHELGLNWGPAEDEGYATAYNRLNIKRLDLRPDLAEIAIHLPQMPYVRESRRMVGIKTLVAADLTRYEKQKLMPTSVAIGDYFMDLHNTDEAIEHDLDPGEVPEGGGAFQVPFETFIPETLDGFVPAEKNISQSRLVSGATRLQPITMLTGQAAGTIAALAVRDNVQPRQLDARAVQSQLLDDGSQLVQRWYADVPVGTPVWKATQLCSLYQVMDRPGPLNGQMIPLGSKSRWGVDAPLSGDEMGKAVARLAELAGKPTPKAATGKTVSADDLSSALASVDDAWRSQLEGVTFADRASVRAGEFAIVASKILLGAKSR